MWRQAIFLIVFILFALYLCLHWRMQESESAYLLSVAQEVLSGRCLYSDVLTSVWPWTLIVYLMPVALAHLLHLHPCFLANLFALVLEFVSLSIVYKLVCQPVSLRQTYLSYLVTGGAMALMFYQVLFLKSLAQPCNLLIFLFLPYLVLSSLSHKRKFVLPSCALAGLAVLLNPLSLLCLAYIEALAFYRRRQHFSWQNIRRESLFLRVLVICFSFALVGLSLYLALGMRQLHLVLDLMLSRFTVFNDALRYVLMSPDRRDLVYLWVFAVILALPFSSRLVFLRSVLALSAFGFFIYLLSISLLTASSLLMVASSFLICGLCLCFLWLKKFGLPEAIARRFKRKYSIALAYLLLLPLALYLFVPGCFGKPILSDLSVFSEVLQEKTLPGDSVFCFSGQNRPAFPLLTQMERRCGYLAESSILLDLKRHRERLCPLGSDSLCQWQDAIHLKIKEELAGDTRPSLLLVEDGDMKEYLKNSGIEAVINDHYIACGYASLLNEDEMKKHEAFEYIGYRTGFSLYRRRP